MLSSTEKQKRIETIKKVYELVKSGVVAKEACRQAGISYPTYYASRKRLAKEFKAKVPTRRIRRLKVIEVPTAAYTPSRSILFVGSVHECLEFMRGVQ